MIDLTPLDVRKKRGDFKRGLRGYDPQEVDTFLELVAERLEALVKENLTLNERVDRLQDQVSSQGKREKAVQEALVTAQELRQEVHGQAERAADLLRREAEAEAERILREVRKRVGDAEGVLEELERQRTRFLRSFRSLLQREMDAVEVEEGRKPFDEMKPIDLDLGAVTTEPRPMDSVSESGADIAVPESVIPDDVISIEALAPSGREGESSPESHG